MLSFVLLNFANREVALKLVYYGPALSGKTTNLQSLHEVTQSSSRGRLMQLATTGDRTLFFDMLPLTLRGAGPSAMSLRVKVFTVPGQVVHAATRKLVLQGADGVAFIADSRASEVESTAASFRDLLGNLKEHGREARKFPVVIQFNKRDIPGGRSDAELRELAMRGREPVYCASATQGHGVLETFFGLLATTVRRLDEEHGLGKRLGLDRDVLLFQAARALGYAGDPRSLLRAALPSSASPFGDLL